MKKRLMGFAVCALIVTSCSKQNIMENITDGDGQLRFAAGSAQQGTKAAELNNTKLQDQEIILYAYQDLGTAETSAWSKWYNDKVVYNKNNSGKWTLDQSVRFRNEKPTKYITYSSKVSGALTNLTNFENPTFATGGTFPQFTYTVAANSATQEDLLASITEVGANKTEITLGMRHILSQINFGTVGYTGANIEIRKIKITGVKNKGVFTYNAANTYPIGNWAPNSGTATYEYYNHINTAATNNPQPLVPATATTGNKYIFGDGGNWGPGKNASTLYPVGSYYAWESYSTVNPQGGLKNSLMLLPQDLTDGAKVTFEYRIKDKDNGYVAGSASTWATGEFALNFSTGTNGKNEAKYYDSKWEQNYRYVYLIDFTDFLDGVALTFKVDVDSYPWENYNNDTDDDGIVDIMSAGQPSQADMNATAFVNGDTWYIATQSETAPNTLNPKKWAQVMRNETWDLSDYNFANIGVEEKFTISFENVIFNPAGTPTKTITLTLPAGYTIANGTGIAIDPTPTNPSTTNTYVLSAGNKSATATATVTITNNDNYTNLGSGKTLEDGIRAITTDAQTIYYKGAGPIDLKTMDNTTLATVGNTIIVKFTNTVIPTVGATTNGIWTWNALTQTATWTKVTWKDLTATKTEVGNAAANAVFYCSDPTNNLVLNETNLGEPSNGTNSPVTVIFKTAATRTAGATTNGVWSYNAAKQTATWTKNVTWNDLDATKTAVKNVTTANAVIYCSDSTTDLVTLGEPSNGTNSPVTVIFKTAATRTAGATTNGGWSYNAATLTATWTKWLDLDCTQAALGCVDYDEVIYCCDNTITDLCNGLCEPKNKEKEVKVVFKDKKDGRNGGETTNGNWEYDKDNKTAKWTKKQS